MNAFPCIGGRPIGCTQGNRVTSVNDLFQLRFLCSLVGLVSISKTNSPPLSVMAFQDPWCALLAEAV
jgi:hypothetical protein